MSYRSVLLSAAFVAIGMICASKASAINVSTSLDYNIPAQVLTGNSRTWKGAGDIDWESFCTRRATMDPPIGTICIEYVYYYYYVATEGELLRPNFTLHSFGSAINWSSVQVNYLANLPDGGQWTANSVHGVIVDAELCEMISLNPEQWSCYWLGLSPIPLAWGNAWSCAGEPAYIRNQYLPNVVYPPPGVIDVPACTDFATAGGSANFTWAELTSGTGNPSHPWAAIRAGLWGALEGTRATLGFGIVVNSGYRTPLGNVAVGSTAQQSNHMSGHAVDIRGAGRPWDEAEWELFRDAALANGFTWNSAFPAYPSHIHVDMR